MIKKHVKKLWQDKWDRGDKGRGFYIVNPEVGQGRLVIRCRREEDIFTRMRIGHTGLNKTLQLIGKHNSGNCEICNVPETVEHVLMMCRKFNKERVLIKRKIEDSGERFIFRDILSKASEHRVIKYMFEFLKNTGLIDRV